MVSNTRPLVPSGVAALLRSATLAVLTLAAGAQTFVVDFANGPGAHFTQIVAALRAVPDGAVLRVRAGVYQPFAIDAKGVTVLGEPGAVVQVTSGAGDPRIENLAAHQRVVIRELQFLPFLGPWGNSTMTVQNCAGPVHLERLSVPFGGNRLIVQQCAHVLVRDCAYTGTVRTTNSDVALCGCTVQASSSVFGALEQNGGRVQVTNSWLRGGIVPGFLLAGPAVKLAGGDLRVLGNSMLDSTGLGVLPAVVIEGTGSVRLDPAVAVLGATSPFAAGIAVTTQAMPLVSAASGPLGGALVASLDGPIGSVAALSVALPGAPALFPGTADPVFWDLATAVPQVAGVLAVGQPLASTIPVPNVAALAGFAVVWHGFTWDPARGLQVSNPAAAVVY